MYGMKVRILKKTSVITKQGIKTDNDVDDVVFDVGTETVESTMRFIKFNRK